MNINRNKKGLTAVDICNIALNKIGHTSIISTKQFQEATKSFPDNLFKALAYNLACRPEDLRKLINDE